MEVLGNPDAPARPAAALFTGAGFADSSDPIRLADIPAQAVVSRRLARIAALCDRLSWDTTQLGWLTGSGPLPAGRIPGMSAIDLNALPVAGSNSPRVPQKAFRRAVALTTLRDRAAGMPDLLAGYIGALRTPGLAPATRVDAALTAFADGLGVPAETVREAASQLLSFDLAVDERSVRDPVGLLDLLNLVTALNRLAAAPVRCRR